MRLKKSDFLALLIEPIISYFAHKDMQSKIDNGCVVIDVRSEQQSTQKPLEASVNIPLSMLRVKFDSLKADREYLLVCDDGSESAAAAFLMIQSGLTCGVLKNGLNSLKNNTKVSAKAKPAISVQETPAATKAKEQAAIAKKQTEKIATQQQQIKAAREKAEQYIIRHKKELAESRARIAKKNQPVPSVDKKTAQIKDKTTKELAKVMAESKAVALRQKETNETMLRAKEVMEQSAAAAEQTRKQAKEEAALIKQTALEEAEYLRATKASQELEKAQTENEAIKLRQEETNKAMLQAEEIMKQSTAAAAQARKKAEKEAALIKQRAIEEAEHLQAEVEAARQKIEKDAARIKKEEDIIKKSALKIKKEADEIRRIALIEAEQIRSEIETTRVLLDEKLQQAQQEEKRNHDAILAKAEKRATKLAATKTQQAETEAEAIRQKAEEDAIRLHDELKETRKQIEAEAASIIEKLNEQAKEAIVAEEQNVRIIEEEILVELVAEEPPVRITKQAEKSINYKAVNIPGLSTIEPLDDDEAKRKAEAIKEKLSQSQSLLKVHKTNNGTILESENDLFIFKEPKVKAAPTQLEEESFTVAHKTKAETALTQIDTSYAKAKLPEASKSFVIYPQREQSNTFENNMFLNQEKAQPSATNQTNKSGRNAANFVATNNIQQFDKQAYLRKRQSSQSNTLAIAASFFLILAGAVFTLHATDTLKVQTIATLFNSGNDTVQPAAFAKTKTIRKKILRANTNANVKKKVTSKMDDIMQGCKNVLSEAENPKK